MPDPALEAGVVLTLLDLLGIFVFALSGGLVAVRKNLDLFGVLVLAGITGLGGGFLRDLLVGAVPPAALEDWRYLTVPVAAGLVTFWFHPALGRMERLVTFFDAAGLGLFCVSGTEKALAAGVPAVSAALLGVTSAVGGGLLRDVVAREVPSLFRYDDIYALPAMAGAAATALLWWVDALSVWTGVAASVVTFALRALAVRQGWRAPLAYRRQSPDG